MFSLLLSFLWILFDRGRGQLHNRTHTHAVTSQRWTQQNDSISQPDPNSNFQSFSYMEHESVVTAADNEYCHVCSLKADLDRCNNPYDVPSNLTVDRSLCDQIGQIPEEVKVLCAKYDKGYYLKCYKGSAMFTCQASCGQDLEAVNKLMNTGILATMNNGRGVFGAMPHMAAMPMFNLQQQQQPSFGNMFGNFQQPPQNLPQTSAAVSGPEPGGEEAAPEKGGTSQPTPTVLPPKDLTSLPVAKKPSQSPPKAALPSGLNVFGLAGGIPDLTQTVVDTIGNDLLPNSGQSGVQPTAEIVGSTLPRGMFRAFPQFGSQSMPGFPGSFGFGRPGPSQDPRSDPGLLPKASPFAGMPDKAAAEIPAQGTNSTGSASPQSKNAGPFLVADNAGNLQQLFAPPKISQQLDINIDSVPKYNKEAGNRFNDFDAFTSKDFVGMDFAPTFGPIPGKSDVGGGSDQKGGNFADPFG